MNNSVCEVCGNSVDPKESWMDDGYEYRHIEYSYCDTCGDIRTTDGKLIFPLTKTKPKTIIY